jgi:hypothetical protein
MKRLHVTLTIRQLKAKVSRLSQTAFKITRKCFKKEMAINKRDWSRLTKKELIAVIDHYHRYIVPMFNDCIKSFTEHGFHQRSFFCFSLPDSNGEWKFSHSIELGQLDDTPYKFQVICYRAKFPDGYQLTIFDKAEIKILVAYDPVSHRDYHLYFDNIPSHFVDVFDLIKSVRMGLYWRFL